MRSKRGGERSLATALARVLIVKGDASARDQALALLARLLRAAELDGRAGIQIEALALRALAHWQGGDRAGAMVSLERASASPNLKATCASSQTSGTPYPGYCRKPAPGM